ncbi:MAG: di-trans,poly-cis-decaprenylcistransferase [Spirochaetaceae bacterium]|nr:MAG: di-trans,poly-cis-decaprenylcistransferase [Spirochaetaceae bacterium]
MGIEESTEAPPPRHIGIIMDGNGRWATSRGLRRTRGHREGIEAAKRVVLAAIAERVPCLSLYAFSTENWRRAEEEVSFIMALVARNLRDQYDFYRENHVRVRHSGNLEGLPEDVQQEIAIVTEETRGNKAITVNLAVNYGGRDEIARSVSRILASRTESALLSPVTAEEIENYLDLPDLPDPDLIIRTGGEHRLSNFLLWESAYSELYFSDRLWPDWCDEDLQAAIADFKRRKRNFGGMR